MQTWRVYLCIVLVVCYRSGFAAELCETHPCACCCSHPVIVHKGFMQRPWIQSSRRSENSEKSLNWIVFLMRRPWKICNLVRADQNSDGNGLKGDGNHWNVNCWYIVVYTVFYYIVCLNRLWSPTFPGVHSVVQPQQSGTNYPKTINLVTSANPASNHA